MTSSKYYKVSTEWRLEVKGVEHQLSVLNPFYDFQMDYSYQKTPLTGKIPDHIYFPVFKLHQDAKLTDVLSKDVSGAGFKVYSEKLIRIVEELNTHQYSTRKIMIISGAKTIDNYYAFHFNDIIEGQEIDWQKSLFSIRNSIDWSDRNSNKTKKELEEIKFDNCESYKMKKAELKSQGDKFMVARKKLFISEDYNYDLSSHVGLLDGLICSQKFKRTIEDNKVIGLRFTPLRLEYDLV